MTTAAQQWKSNSEAFVLGHLPEPPGRVLEIGCGSEGGYAVALAEAGHDVVAVDPVAPAGPLFRQTTFEELDDPGPFDRVVSSLALHHVGDLGLVLDKVASIMADDGRLVLIEWAWERFDDASAEWCLERLPAEGTGDGWLSRRHEEWRTARAGQDLSFAAHLKGWARGEGLHDSATMLTKLSERFEAELLEWGPYLYPELAGTSEEDERAAIDAGDIQATCLRFVGRRA